jgi:rubrerythrin
MPLYKENLYNMNSIERLLAHSLALETDAVERYREIADAMEVHNNPEVAQLFNTLAAYAQKHAGEMKMKSKGLTIPHIAPWDFIWADGDSPEAADMFHAHYKMTPYHVLQIALKVETDARDFYAKIAAQSTHKEVVALAAEFADEENEHVEMLMEWMARYPEPDHNWNEDLDPPMMHE